MRADMYARAVLQKCELFGACNLWASEPRLRPRAWLSNFEPDEQAVAAVLLDHFAFFGASAVDQLLRTGVRRLQSIIKQFGGDRALEEFAANVVFTAVAGEDPNPTDSGLLFCRKVRQILRLPDTRFVPLRDALTHASRGRPVVFLDDFVGSGEQIVSTWELELPGLGSFAQLSATRAIDVSYLTLISSETGYQRLTQELPQVRVVVAHIANGDYSVRQLPRSPVRPNLTDLPAQIEALLDKYHLRLDLPRYLSTPAQRKYGFSELGLLLAFDHSVPDASVPLLWAQGGEGWTALVERA